MHGLNLPKNEAIKILEQIRRSGELDKIWSDFVRTARKDLALSIGRMGVGALILMQKH